MAEAILRILLVAWGLLEIVLAVHNRVARRAGVVRRDRGSKLVMIVAIALGLWLAVHLRGVAGTSFAGNRLLGSYLAALLVLLGLVIRIHAVATLGGLFTTTVTIRSQHKLVRGGLYGHIRHPAYLGTLLLFAGLGLSLQNWLSAAIILVLLVPAILYRIRVEERALVAAFGTEYSDYAKATRRLIPGLYWIGIPGSHGCAEEIPGADEQVATRRMGLGLSAGPRTAPSFDSRMDHSIAPAQGNRAGREAPHPR